MKKIAVVCAPGIGDALILHIASHALQSQGFETTTFSDHLPHFGKWLTGYRFAPQPTPDQIEKVFAGYDAVFLQHDNSFKAKKIRALNLPVYTFYGSHNPSKHGALRLGFDYVCDPNQTMVENVQEALLCLFRIENRSKDNGLRPPLGLTHRKYPKRIAIHPLSGNPFKNWPRSKFLQVAAWLEAQGHQPVFLTPETERERWPGPKLKTLSDLTSYIYESGFFFGNDSGPGHIASCLSIPHLIVGTDEWQMRLWRPGWLQGETICPPSWVPNWKGLRLREKKWKNFTTTRRVINTLKYNVLNK